MREDEEGAEEPSRPAPKYGWIDPLGKVAYQLVVRGWTPELIDEAITTPDRTVPVRDRRRIPKTMGGGGRLDEPATRYEKAGSFLVVNDQTGEVIQISDRTDPGFSPRVPGGRMTTGKERLI